MKLVSLDVLSPVPTYYRHCRHCEDIFDQADIARKTHEGEISEYPAEFLADHARLSDWLRELQQSHGQRISIRLIDPQSLAGLWLALRYRIRKYPTFIVNGKHRFTGWDKDALARLLAEQWQAAS